MDVQVEGTTETGEGLRGLLANIYASTDHSSPGSWTKKPSITVSEKDVDLPAVTKEALKHFSVSSPDIILAFISDTKCFTSWKNEDHRAALQKGIIKIFNACETWIIDSGIDYGLSSMLGHAVKDEQRYRKSRREYEVYAKGHLQKRHFPLVLMGVTPTALLNQTTEIPFAKQDSMETFKTDPSHTHFVFLEGSHAQHGALQAEIVVELAHQAVHLLREIPNQKQTATLPLSNGSLEKPVKHGQIPLIAVLVQGDQEALTGVHTYLEHGVPVLLLKGTGMMADLISFAFEEDKDRNSSSSHDVDIVKSELSKRLMRSFPNVTSSLAAELCQTISDCVDLAKQSERQLMSVVASSDNLSDLDNFVLSAVFAARSSALNALPQQILDDFLLTTKLNRPLIAKSKVLSRDVDGVCLADNSLFEKALLWKGREAFVEKFMEEDFVVHKFLSHSRLLRLFRLAENHEFFVGLVEDFFPSRTGLNDGFEESLVTVDLNVIIEQLTAFPNFLSMHDLSSNYFGLYAQDADVAERKAMNALIVWAVLMNRVSLAQTLLKFCPDPIPVALFISALYSGLAKHSDDSLTTTLQGYARMFSTTAIDVLDMSYKESSARTFDLLNQKFADFNNKTPIKMAFESENKFFLAHEACQIWLNRLWEGGITVFGPTDALISPEVKLILSALLLFPINFWIQFAEKKHEMGNEAEEMNGSLTGEGYLLNSAPLGGMGHQHNDHLDLSSPDHSDKSEVTLKTLEELSFLESQLKSNRKPPKNLIKRKALRKLYRRQSKPLPFWKKIYYLWSAPRTKFWIFQVFYWAYLAVFSIAVMLPTCHDTSLDIVIFIWTLFNVIEIALRTAYQHRHDFPVSIRRRVIEIILITVFVLAAIVLKTYFTLIRPLYTRALMAIGLLYMYYRMISVFFPMNADLGPTLYRIKRMILVDFVSFVRLALPFILANLFVLQATMYPDLPLSIETWRQGFHRAFFTLFTAFIGEIEYSPRCEATRIYNTSDVCWTGDYADYTCPTLGVISYVLNIQYWIIMRLILMVLLSALFAATMIKVKEDAEYIFKYQRYSTVLDFASRAALPPPLSVLGYAFDWIVACFFTTKRIDRTRQRNLTDPRSIKLINKRSTVVRSNESYSYWMGLTKEYYRKKTQEEKENKLPMEQLKKINELAADHIVLRGESSVLKEKMTQLENTISSKMQSSGRL